MKKNDIPFLFRLYFRVGILVLLIIVFSYFVRDPDFFFTSIIFLLLCVLSVLELSSFVGKTNKELTKFLMALKHRDFSISYGGDELGATFKELHDIFRDISRQYGETQTEMKAQFQLLQLIIDRMDLGLIVVSENDELLLFNIPAEKLLGISGKRNWKSVEAEFPEFTHEIGQIRNEGRKLVELHSRGDLTQLSLQVTNFQFMEKDCKLITFRDIQSELEQKEIEAWHKLIRILTHEIMNSVTPLSSLTDTILMMVQNQDGELKKTDEFTSENISDIQRATSTIKGRSQGILKFIDDYRKLTNVPHPEKRVVDLEDLISSVTTLYKAEIEQKGIKLVTRIDESPLISEIDPNLMEQVLINLLSNSIHAVENSTNPEIIICAKIAEGTLTISVEDNGKGIESGKMGKIFIPFFSTRAEGSGIGLSLSKHIVYLHNGRIKAESEPGVRTAFTITMPVK